MAHSIDDLARERNQKVKTLLRREEERHAQDLAKRLNLPYYNLKTTPLDGAALTLRPLDEQKEADAVVVRRVEHTLYVATTINPNSAAFEEFRAALEKAGFTVVVWIVSPASLEHAWASFPRFAYLQTRTTGEVSISQETVDRLQKEILDIGNLTRRLAKVTANDIATLVELLLAGALRLGASDIHVEPLESAGSKVRYRLDGVLHDLIDLHRDVYKALVDRLKLLSGLKLNITLRGQDGRFTIRAYNQEVEVRVSTLPGPNGEFVVMRILNPQSLIDIPELGLRPDLLTFLEEELKRPNGMLLTTGPTGSGKTTLLYASLRKVVTPDVKAITIEDPIEYRVPGLEQTQVNPTAGYTFASGLRSIVRQDPDIVLVGEIRDEETAGIAINSALTGHLVFSTLHTNDAAGALPRLIDLKVDPAILGPAINVVMAQRLIRRVCHACAKKAAPAQEVADKIRKIISNIPEKIGLVRNFETLPEAAGCADCHGTGYKGRIGIFEMFPVDEDVEKFMLGKPSVAQVRSFAIERGMITLQQDALLRVIEGISTIDEVVRITGPLSLPHDANVPIEPKDR